MKSEAALLAEYGELGLYGVVSLKAASSRVKSPKTSSVDTCKNLKFFMLFF